ncbi:hypothetical protein Tco_1170852 [Tanacetum coccineum]
MSLHQLPHHFNLPSFQVPQRAPLNLKGNISRKTREKKVMSLKDAEEKGSESDFDDTIHLTGSMVESPKKKKLKEFDFVIEVGDYEESAKAEAAKHEVEVRKKELVDLLGPDVVSKYYKAKLQYDKYCDKMLNIRESSKITNCDVLTKKGPITMKVYREDGTSEVIPNFKSSDLHLGEWREVVNAYPNRKGKGWSTIYGQI